MSEPLSTFQIDIITENRFEKLPNEMLEHIFSFASSAVDLDNLSAACKRFHHRIRTQLDLWKSLCNRFWTLQAYTKKVQLEKVVQQAEEMNSEKSWMWFARCFGNCLSPECFENGLSWKYTKYEDENKNWLRIGEMKEGKLHGFGIHIFLDGRKLVIGNTIEGSFREATVVWENGARYTGQLNNLKNGFGIMTWADGNKYEGHWKNDTSLHCREGYGVLTWAAGNRYEGNWRASKTNGHGKHTFANGDVLEGERKDDKAHGHCQMTWFTSNFVYDGKWTAGEPNDQEGCLHPAIRKSIANRQCTGFITGTSKSYGQFYYRCQSCKINFCAVCYESCHLIKENCMVKRTFGLGTHCSCSHNLEACKHNSDIETPHKRQKL